MENSTEEKIKDIVLKIGKIRKIPQFLFVGSIYPKSVQLLRDNIYKFKKENLEITELDFIINSPGGSPDDAYRIIRTLRQNFDIVNIIVPFWAKSAATLLSLGGSQIIMDEFGEFGPLDVQIAKRREDSPDFDRESALIDEKSLEIIEDHSKVSFIKTYRLIHNSDNDILIKKTELSKQIFDFLSDFYKPLLSKIDPYKLGDKKRKLDIGKDYADKILRQYNKKLKSEDRRYLVDFLVNDCPDHGYIIDFDEINKYLPNVVKSEDIGKEYKGILGDLTTLFIELKEDILFVDFIVDKKENENSELKKNNNMKK